MLSLFSVRVLVAALLPLSLAAGSSCSATLSNAVLAQVAAKADATPQYGEAPAIRSYFYVGGGYDSTSSGHVYKDQMYVEKLVPANGVTKSTPIIFIHGQAQTGTNWLDKPDGSRGWASEFVDQGYEVYIVDQPFRGRSPWQPYAGAVTVSTYSAEIIQQRFTAVKNYMLWPQAINHTQWVGSGVMGDKVFDTYYSSNVQFINNATYQQMSFQKAGAALLDKIAVPCIIFAHSQGGALPLLMADVRPAMVKSIVLLEPTGPTFRDAIFSTKAARPYGLTDIPLTYDPPVVDPATDLIQQEYEASGPNLVRCVLQAEDSVRTLPNLVSKPILLVTSEASYHAPYDYCTVNYLRQAGCLHTRGLFLPDIGIHGNGHLFFMEKNSRQIQAVLEYWISHS